MTAPTIIDSAAGTRATATATAAPASTAEVLLDARGLDKRLGAVAVTQQVSIQVRAGEIHALIGPNGAGKTSLVHQLSGLLRPDAGQITLRGEDITRLPMPQRVQRGLVRTFQITNVLTRFTLTDNLVLALMARRRGWGDWLRPVPSRRAMFERAADLISQVGLAEAGQPVGLLSYGEQRRLEIALALALEPSVLLLDEPMAGLSTQESEQMASLLSTLARSCGLLLIEHDMKVVFGLGQRISVLVGGRLIASGNAEQIREHAEVRAAYLGED